MLKNNILILIFLLCYSSAVVAQEKKTCNKPKEEVELDLNSITKCANGSKDEVSSLSTRNSKKVNIEVSSRRRVIRRRATATSASSIKASNKLDEIKKSTSLVGELDLANKNVAEKLPYNFVEEKPLFSSCKDVAIVEQEKCFKKELHKHIKKNFKYPESSYSKSIQGRVLVQFVIDEFGTVRDVVTRGPIQGEELENEAKRIIERLPKINPGKMAGTPIKVKYGTAIAFKIPGKAPSNVKIKSKENVVLGEVVNFSKVQKIPLFKSCINKKSDDDKLDCFNEKLQKHIQKYFAYPEEAAKKNIEGRVYAYFVIDKDGDVVNIKTRGPKNGKTLEYATKKLVEKLPKFIPGTQNGQPTNVKYAFPINFKLN